MSQELPFAHTLQKLLSRATAFGFMLQ